MIDLDSTPLTPLQKAQAALKAKREAGALTPRARRPSMRKAINDKCKDCIYDPKSGMGTWKQQTDACTIMTCSLWPLRPRSVAGPLAKQASEGSDDNKTPIFSGERP